MSLFADEHLPQIRSAIKFFNDLAKERKAFVVANLLDLSEEERQKLGPLLVSVRNDISMYETTEMTKKLSDLGLEQTYAVLLVDNMKQQAPTIEYQLKELTSINDEQSGAVFADVMRQVWIEQRSVKEIVDKTGITKEQLSSIINLSRNYMTGLLRSTTTAEKIDKQCRDAGLSAKKTDALIDILSKEADPWGRRLVFSNTQDSFFILQEIQKQNKALLDSVVEILNLLKKITTPPQNDQSYYR